MTFANPVPLLLHHDTRSPVGTATFHPPTAEGIRFSAQIAKIAEPGVLRDRTNEAWARSPIRSSSCEPAACVF
jgi:hypothetical protein